jgi:arsenite-transporting ATPase
MEKILFFLGKGGVGKTTLSASLAQYLANRGKNVYIVSLDPAHNLFDYFHLPPASGMTRVTDTLFIEECNIDSYIKELLRETSQRMRDTYKYFTILNLEGMFDLLRHTPGMEEFGFISALDEVFEKRASQFDYVIIDMPPTGLSLRIFSMPVATHHWIENLISLRKKILSRRREITHVKGKDYFGEGVAMEEGEDPVLVQLSDEYDRSVRIERFFKNRETTGKVLVVNYDELSIKEAMLIIKDFKCLDIAIDYIVFNKAGLSQLKEKYINELKELSEDSIWVDIPYYSDSTTPREHALEIGEILYNIMGQ